MQNTESTQRQSQSEPTTEESAAIEAVEMARAALHRARAALADTLGPIAEVEAQRDGSGPHPMLLALEARENVAKAIRKMDALLEFALASATRKDDPLPHLQAARYHATENSAPSSYPLSAMGQSLG
jgi:hypothetical protein